MCDLGFLDNYRKPERAQKRHAEVVFPTRLHDDFCKATKTVSEQMAATPYIETATKRTKALAR